MEAAARPLPREETTPPVTKMYLTGRSRSSLCHVVRSGPGGSRDELPHPFQILRSIDADGVCGGFSRDDAVAVFERAKLFEAFRLFERRRGSDASVSRKSRRYA